MKIALIGTYPPPYGGRSIHIQRLKRQLGKKENIVVYNIGGKLDKPEDGIIRIKNSYLWFLRYFFLAKEDVIHYHGSNWFDRMIIGLMSLRGKKTIVTLHSNVALKDDFKKGNWFKKFLIKLGLRQTTFIIVVNPETKNFIVSLGVKSEKVKCIPAFVPPIIKKEDIDEIPHSIWNFIANHKPLILANAFRIVFYNNQDLYGINMCIDLCATLKNNYSQIGFIFCLPDIGDYEYFNKMKQKIKEKGIENNFLFQTKPCQLYPIIMKSDVFVRPTNIDGYGVSIAEAIYFKVPAVASNVCQRPGGTILFKSRNIEEFTSRVKDVLANYEHYKKRLETVKIANNSEKILKVFEELQDD